MLYVEDHSLFSKMGLENIDEMVKMRVGVEELYDMWKERIEERRPFHLSDAVSKNKGLRSGVRANLGTGSGALAIGVGRVLGIGGRVIATDLSPVAVAVAAYNVQRYCLQDKIEVREGSWFEPLKDMKGKLAGLTQPRVALDGGIDGMDALLHLCDGVALFLKPGGFFAFEVSVSSDHGYSILVIVAAL
ncbi:hypothetical protein RIF29_11866 [Crotalaria pallida]|uniref:Methyltransferase n=1 Tax=Crotalaria pallida TaxID=3830 RepID=A0AAN9P0K3_CROPI